jgi:hypothetical protein
MAHLSSPSRMTEGSADLPMNPSCRTPRKSAVATLAQKFKEWHGSYAARLQQICRLGYTWYIRLGCTWYIRLGYTWYIIWIFATFDIVVFCYDIGVPDIIGFSPILNLIIEVP